MNSNRCAVLRCSIEPVSRGLVCVVHVTPIDRLFEVRTKCKQSDWFINLYTIHIHTHTHTHTHFNINSCKNLAMILRVFSAIFSLFVVGFSWLFLGLKVDGVMAGGWGGGQGTIHLVNGNFWFIFEIRTTTTNHYKQAKLV